MRPPVNLEDMRRRARRRLPALVFDYLEGGAGGERGLARNRAALERVLFRPRRLTDVSACETGIELFGRRYPVPLIVAPTGLNGVFWPDGDILLARAAARAGIPFCLSTASTVSIEDVARAAPQAERWFQLYVVERALAERLVARAAAADYGTLVLTVDVPVTGRRERDLRSGFRLPFRLTPRIALDCARRPVWSLRQLAAGLPQLANLASDAEGGAAAQAALLARRMDASFSWRDLARLRALWRGRLLVKGVLCAEDARRCAEEGADGVIVSNHGGRQLEDSPAPVTVLPEVVAAAGVPVLVDSGFRTGADVAKALALGASAVLIGRPLLYGLAAAGEAGVRAVLDLLREELETTLALLGCARAVALDASFLAGQ